MQKTGLIFVISGPSGSGKTTLLRHLLKKRVLGNRLCRCVSVTTRPRRTGERNGRDYIFITERDFKSRLKNKKILEWTKYLGYYYATPKDCLEAALAKGRVVGLCLDFRGALKIKKLYPSSTVTIFVLPPSLQVLKNRISRRCSKICAEEVQKRIGLARQELLLAKKYDYSVVNKDFDQAADTLKEIMIKQMRGHCRRY